MRKKYVVYQMKENYQYDIIHFATHAAVLPEIPELSALILSQNNEIINKVNLAEPGKKSRWIMKMMVI